MLDTLFLKDGSIITGVIKMNPNSTKKIKICKGVTRKKTAKCIKQNATEVDSFVEFYRSVKVKGFLGFGKKEYKIRSIKYYTINFKNTSKAYAKLTKKGNNYDFYHNSYIDYETLKQFILVTKPNNREVISWFKPGNINENIRNAKKAFPKCEEKLEIFRKNKTKKEISIIDFIDENCE